MPYVPSGLAHSPYHLIDFVLCSFRTCTQSLLSHRLCLMFLQNLHTVLTISQTLPYVPSELAHSPYHLLTRLTLINILFIHLTKPLCPYFFLIYIYIVRSSQNLLQLQHILLPIHVPYLLIILVIYCLYYNSIIIYDKCSLYYLFLM